MVPLSPTSYMTWETEGLLQAPEKDCTNCICRFALAMNGLSKGMIILYLYFFRLKGSMFFWLLESKIFLPL